MSTVNTSELSIGLDFSASSQMKIFPKCSFFKEGRALILPSPAEIRPINKESGITSFNRPPPVIFPSMGLWLLLSSTEPT